MTSVETGPATTSRPAGTDRLARAAGLIAASTVASRGLGLIRDILIAALFGATSAKSAFVIAYSLPFFIQRLFMGGILSIVFIPAITTVLVRGDAKEIRRVVTTTLNLVLIIGLAMVAVGVLAAPLLVPLAAPGYLRTNPAVLASAIGLTRIMFVSMVFLALSAFVTGFLNAHHRFAVPALAPLVFNVVIIATVAFLAPRWGIRGVAVSFLLGWAAQFAVQLPAARRAGLRWGGRLDLRHPVILEMGRLALPAMLGLAVIEINSNVDRFFASFLPPRPAVDYVAVLDYAFTINQAPVSIFALSLATALFPTMARRAAEGPELLRETTSLGLRGILFTMVPVTAVMLTLSDLLVRVLFQRGAFDPRATHAVALGLVGFAVGSVAYAGYYIVTRTFYALHDTRTPVRVGVYMILLNALADVVLMRWLGHTGIALSTSIVALANVWWLSRILAQRLGGLDERSIFQTAVRTGVAGLALAAASLGTLWAAGKFVNAETFGGAAAQLGAALFVGGTVYLGVCALLGVPELSLLRSFVRGRQTARPSRSPVGV